MTAEMIVLAAGAVAWLAISVFFWRMTRHMSGGSGLMRALVLLVALGLPLALFALVNLQPLGDRATSPGPMAEAPAGGEAASADGATATGPVKYRGKTRTVSPLEEKSAGEAAERPTAPLAPPATQPAPSPTPAPAPAPAPSDSAIAPATPPAASPAPAAPAPMPAANDKYDSVPVFYGTDRDRIDIAGRVGYGSERARRLELGRAVVTIPKAHVPGLIERPFEVVVLGIKVYGEDESPDKHFTIYSVTPLDRDAFLAEVKKRLGDSKTFKDHALVFVHGYNTSFDNALYRSAQISYDLGFDGAPFLYSWPSQGQLTGYTYDQNSAEQAQEYMQKFLDLVIQETGAKNVTIIAHSMGNLPMLRILDKMQATAAASQSGVRINQIILAAPDVDRDVFRSLTSSLSVLSDNVTLYASANDRAMQASRKVGGAPRAGDVPETGPVVTTGVDTVDVSNISTDILALNHNHFAERSQLLQDIGKIMREGLRPPPKREPHLDELNTDAGAYWKFPQDAPK